MKLTDALRIETATSLESAHRICRFGERFGTDQAITRKHQKAQSSFSWQYAIGELLRFPRNPKGFGEYEFELRSKVGTICSGVGSRCTDSTLQTSILRAQLWPTPGNGVELYWDRPKEEWTRTPDGALAMFTRTLDMDRLLNETLEAGNPENQHSEMT